jgi:hypothetical protein
MQTSKIHIHLYKIHKNAKYTPLEPSRANLSNKLDLITFVSIMNHIKFQEVKNLRICLHKFMYVHTLDLGMHIHIILCSLYKILHIYFLSI